MTSKQTKFKETELEKTPKDWETFELKDVIDFDPTRSIRKGDRVKFVAMTDIGIFNKHINNCTVKEFNGGSKFQNGDTLLARITPCLENGKTAFVDILTENEIAGGSTEFIVMAEKKGQSVSEFVYYLAISPEFRELAIQAMVGTSGRQRVQIDKLKSHEMALPTPPEQQKIAGVLGALDEKIELNRKMNKTLESLAHAIFKKWFIDDSDSNWETKKLEEFGKVICGKTPSKSKAEYFGGIIPFIKIPDMHGQTFVIKTEDSLTEEGQMNQTNKTIPTGSVCVSCIATVGLVSIASAESQTNQQINSIVPDKSEYTFFLYLKLKEIKQDLLDMASGGSATLNINTGTFSSIAVVAPSDEELTKFDLKVRPLFEKILLNLNEIETLSHIRDSLLPRLMSGKLRVI
jgi:type I restriction enzyme S subunit